MIFKKTSAILAVLIIPFSCSISNDKDKIPPGVPAGGDFVSFPQGVVEYRNTWGGNWGIDSYFNSKGKLILSFVCEADSMPQMKNWDSLNSLVLKRKLILESMVLNTSEIYYGCMFEVRCKGVTGFSAGFVFDRQEKKKLTPTEKADLFFNSMGIDQRFYVDKQKGYGSILLSLQNRDYTQDSLLKFSRKIMPFIHVVIVGGDASVNRYGFDFRYGQFDFPDKWYENIYARKRQYRFALYTKDMPGMYKID